MLLSSEPYIHGDAMRFPSSICHRLQGEPLTGGRSGTRQRDTGVTPLAAHTFSATSRKGELSAGGLSTLSTLNSFRSSPPKSSPTASASSRPPSCDR